MTRLGIIVFGAIAAAIVALGVMGALWIRADAKEECNLEWGQKLEEANRLAHNEIEAANLRIRSLQRDASQKLEASEKEREELAKQLEEQRKSVPTSGPCTECRIPRDRVLVRSHRTSGRSLEGEPTASRPRQADATDKARRLFRPNKKRVLSSRAGSRIYLRRETEATE